MKKNESGRSMVEMLGVLAIIGVLSVGGIAGYTLAMKKYKANEAANVVALAAVECLSTGKATVKSKYVGVTCKTPATGEITLSFTKDTTVTDPADQGTVEAILGITTSGGTYVPAS